MGCLVMARNGHSEAKVWRLLLGNSGHQTLEPPRPFVTQSEHSVADFGQSM